MNADELLNRFEYHPHPADIPGVEETHYLINKQMGGAAEMVLDNTPECRERRIAFEKLEEAMFWANAAVARHHEHYRPTEALEGSD